MKPLPLIFGLVLFSTVFWMLPSKLVHGHCTWSHIGHCLKGVYKKPVKIITRSLNKTRDVTLDVVEDLGEEFESFICDTLQRDAGRNCHVGIGISYDSKKKLVLLDGNGNPSDIDNKNEESLSVSGLLAWNKLVELEDWMSANVSQERYLIGGLIMLNPALPSNINITWFEDLPSVPTVSGKIRKGGGGAPLVGARRTDNIRVTQNDGSVVMKKVLRLHKGTDYGTSPEENIFAPIDGEIVISNKMISNPVFSYVVIKGNSGIFAKILYVNPTVKKGDKVTKKSLIGRAQDLHVKGGYGASVDNHVHVEYISGDYSLSPDGKYAVTRLDGKSAYHCKDTKCFSPSRGYFKPHPSIVLTREGRVGWGNPDIEN